MGGETELCLWTKLMVDKRKSIKVKTFYSRGQNILAGQRDTAKQEEMKSKYVCTL